MLENLNTLWNLELFTIDGSLANVDDKESVS